MRRGRRCLRRLGRGDGVRCRGPRGAERDDGGPSRRTHVGRVGAGDRAHGEGLWTSLFRDVLGGQANGRRGAMRRAGPLVPARSRDSPDLPDGLWRQSGHKELGVQELGRNGEERRRRVVARAGARRRSGHGLHRVVGAAARADAGARGTARRPAGGLGGRLDAVKDVESEGLELAGVGEDRRSEGPASRAPRDLPGRPEARVLALGRACLEGSAAGGDLADAPESAVRRIVGRGLRRRRRVRLGLADVFYSHADARDQG
mmetsp:Transcript_9633/g.30866  ORF Transcript_9633/g.30866 Transcript_9633/m.30866 type:complete len:260 (+) Transcript_9633:369-1148(+)